VELVADTKHRPDQRHAALAVDLAPQLANVDIEAVGQGCLEQPAGGSGSRRSRRTRSSSTDGVSNDISMIDVEAGKVLNSVKVGSYSCEVAVKG
jgi:YVTN family beta-propeller protein